MVTRLNYNERAKWIEDHGMLGEWGSKKKKKVRVNERQISRVGSS